MARRRAPSTTLTLALAGVLLALPGCSRDAAEITAAESTAVENSAAGATVVEVAAVEVAAAESAESKAAGRETGAPETRARDDAQPADAPPAAPLGELSAKRLAYLAESASQARRLEALIHDLGPNRLGSAALAASALAAAGRPAWAGPAASWVAAALDRCTGDWDDLDCEVALLSLQRVALQFPDALPEALRRRLRKEAASAAPPPGPELVRDPWAFRRTENQQMVVMARSLAAHAVAGTGGSPAARAWAEYAAAFLVAHDRDGWYEADSPGYMGTSITALLHLFDHAPDRRVRDLAGRQLQLLFVEWAENQVGGIPAGPRTRTYLHWAQGVRNTPWPAWFHYATGVGRAADAPLGDWPEIATSGYEFPDATVELLRAGGAGAAPYAVRSRRHIRMQHRRDLDAATSAWVTPDYVLGTAPAVDGLSLAVSGGQEIQVTLFPHGADFAPLYLWSRAGEPRGRRWRSLAGREQAVGWQNLALARMGTAEEPGYAWLAPPWSRPEPVAGGREGDEGGGEGGGEVLVSRYGETYVALVTAGGWQLAPAPRRFPDYFGDKASRGSWVAVPRRQPAAIGLEVGRASEVGGWPAWRERASRLRLVDASAAPGRGGDDGGGGSSARAPRAASAVLTLRASDGRRLVFRPGVAASLDGEPLTPGDWPLHASPFLTHRPDGAWHFRRHEVDYRFAPLSPVESGGG